MRIFTENWETTNFSWENIIVYSEFSVSWDWVNIPNVKWKITFSKANVTKRPDFSKLESATNLQITEDSENWYAEYSFRSIYGWMISASSITYSIKAPYTPDGFRKPITFELFSEDGSSLWKVSETFTTKTKPVLWFNIPTAWSLYRNYDWTKNWYLKDAWGNLGSILKTIQKNGENITEFTINSTSDESTTNTRLWENAPYVGYAIWIQKYEWWWNEWKYIPQNVKIEYKLPDWAEMKWIPNEEWKYSYGMPNDKNSAKYLWTYDANTKTAIYEWSINNYYQQAIIQLSYPGTNFWYVYKTTAKITLDPNTDNEKTLPEVSTAIAFKHVEYTPNASISFTKFWAKGNYKYVKDVGYLWKYFYSKDISSSDNLVGYILSLLYDTNFNLENSDKAPKIYIKEIEDHDMDSRLDYYKLEFCKEEKYNLFKVNWFKFIWVKENDEEVILWENVKSVDLSNSAERYKKIILRFNTPYKMTKDRISDFLFIYAKVKDEVYDGWKNEILPSVNDYSSDNYVTHSNNNVREININHMKGL